MVELMAVYTRRFGTGNRSKNSIGMIGRILQLLLVLEILIKSAIKF